MTKYNYERFAVMTIILIVLITIFFTKDRFNFLSYSSTPNFENLLNTGDIQLTIDDGDTVSHFIKRDNIWYVKVDGTEYEADQDKVKKLLSNISNLKRDEVATNDKLDHEKFGIGTHKITVTSPDSTFALYIGKAANLSRNYVRVNEENKVYLAEGLNDIFSSEYRDMTIGLVQNENMVQTITINNGENSTKIEQVDGDWLIDEKKIEKEKVSFYINDLKTFKVQGAEPVAQELNDPYLSIEVDERGQSNKAEFYNQGDESFVKVSNHNGLLKVDEESVEAIIKNGEDFLE